MPGPLRPRELRRHGGVLTSLTIGLALAALAGFVWVLQSDVEGAQFSRVETASVRMDVGADWVDARWQQIVRERIARLSDFDCEDAGARARVVAELAALPFVRSIDAPAVLWPDGLRIDIRLRVPVACVQVGREFLPISADGMLLPGAWPSPPRRGAGHLPVIALDLATSSDQPGVIDASDLRAGQVLWNAQVADGLSVAASLWDQLDSDDLLRLGRSIIDARRARETSVEEPGTVIHLERSRRIHFGRAPSTAEPGELPVATKWLNTANALICLPSGPPAEPGGAPTAREGEVDWELVEVRWDHPAMLPRGRTSDPTARVEPRQVKPPKPERAQPKSGEGARRDGDRPSSGRRVQ